MIPVRQYLHHHGPGIVLLPELRTNENGTAELVMVNQAERILPDPETTRLRNVLESGVDLKRVPSKVMSSTEPLTVSFGDETQTTQSTTEPESKEQ